MLYLLAIFVIIVLIVIVLLVMPQHWFAEKDKAKRASKPKPARPASPVIDEKFQGALDKESAKLERVLQQKAAIIDQEFTSKLNAINSKQLKDYEQALAASLQKTLKNLHDASAASDVAHQDYKKSLEEELKKAKARVVERVDAAAADIMISYLAEVAADIDYQQQKDYLYKSLEANLPALKKDIQNGL